MVNSRFKPKLAAMKVKQDDAGWDLGMADLIEETPMGTENRKTRFRISEAQGESNVVLLRPDPSWKQK